jgi:hypothetical protein
MEYYKLSGNVTKYLGDKLGERRKFSATEIRHIVEVLSDCNFFFSHIEFYYPQ